MTQFKKLALLTVVTLVGGNVNAASRLDMLKGYGKAGIMTLGAGIDTLRDVQMTDSPVFFGKCKLPRPTLRNTGRAVVLAALLLAGYKVGQKGLAFVKQSFSWAKGKLEARKKAKQIAADAALAARMQAEGTAERTDVRPAVRRRL